MEIEVVPRSDILLAEHAEAIRVLGRRVVGDVIEIGRRLVESKRICGHGRWLPWLEREFAWTDKTAERYINVFQMVSKFDNLSNLDIPLSGLYLIAAAPEEAQTEVLESAVAGQKMSLAEVEKMVADAGDAAVKKAEQQIDHMRKKHGEEIALLTRDLEGALTSDDLKQAIIEAMAPLEKKLKKAQEKLDALRSRAQGPKDEFGLRAQAISSALSRLTTVLQIEPKQMIEAQKVISQITGQTMAAGLFEEIKNARQAKAWLEEFLKQTRSLK
jgi:ribosome-associated translation inhibitor RaiA